MSKVYYISWPSTSTGDPRGNFGLTPTFLIFNNNGTPVTPPAISAVSGATGIYAFAWGTTTPIAFLIDGFTTSLGAQRYITNSIDPADSINETGASIIAQGNTLIALGTTNVALGISNIALGTTNVALGTSILAISVTILSSIGSGATLVGLIGSLGSTFGGQSTDPIDLFGYMKRFQELMEGDNYYFKATGALDLYSRGSSTLLRIKSIANSISTVIKTGQ